jgi:hypothetical protein
MAIVENPLIGETRGSLGNAVFSVQFGKNTLRTKSLKARVGRTPGQELSRERFKILIPLLKPILRFINAAYAGTVQGMNPHNRVMSINTKNCFINDTSSIDPSRFVFCENDGSFVDNFVLSSTVENTITGTFDSNAQNADEDADPVSAYGFDVDGNKIWKFDESAIRSTGTLTLTRSDMSGKEIAVYMECLDRVNLINGEPRHVIKYVGKIVTRKSRQSAVGSRQ